MPYNLLGIFNFTYKTAILDLVRQFIIDTINYLLWFPFPVGRT